MFIKLISSNCTVGLKLLPQGLYRLYCEWLRLWIAIYTRFQPVNIKLCIFNTFLKVLMVTSSMVCPYYINLQWKFSKICQFWMKSQILTKLAILVSNEPISRSWTLFLCFFGWEIEWTHFKTPKWSLKASN